MRERPILFSGPMVQAILAGRKTVTRRVIKGQAEFFEPDTAWSYTTGHSGGGWYAHSTEYPDEGSLFWRCPYGQPGDLLYVRETFFDAGEEEGPGRLHYKASATQADLDWAKQEGWRWRPSIHMPKWAARIWLEVTSVRVERLQEVTPTGAADEGMTRQPCRSNHSINPDCGLCLRDKFAELWASISAKPKPVLDGDGTGEILYYVSYPWEDIQETREHKGKEWRVVGNPWVWVVGFNRVEQRGMSLEDLV